MRPAAWETGRLGLGCGSLGQLSEEDAEQLVHTALALGVSFFDTARSYGSSEAWLGRALKGRAALRSTKGGYGVEPVAEWTAPAITAGIERARRALQVDRLDVFFLHSCPVHVMERPGLLDALVEAKVHGLVAAVGYSGDGDALRWAVDRGPFDAVQASFSLFDQQNGPALLAAKARGLKTVAKRALGGAPWRGVPTDDAGRHYLARMKALPFTPALDWESLAVRFSAHAPEIDVALVGTTKAAHLRSAVKAVEQGPLPAALDAELRAWFAAHPEWTAQI